MHAGEREGAYVAGVRAGQLNACFGFVYPMRGGVARVTVRLYYDPDHRQGWVFASRRPDPMPEA